MIKTFRILMINFYSLVFLSLQMNFLSIKNAKLIKKDNKPINIVQYLVNIEDGNNLIYLFQLISY